jgi:hypothetical protein
MEYNFDIQIKHISHDDTQMMFEVFNKENKNYSKDYYQYIVDDCVANNRICLIAF